MTTRLPPTHQDFCAPVLYAWRIVGRQALHLEGPISRPATRRRHLELSLRDVPAALRAALREASRESGTASLPLTLGHRTLVVLATDARSGYLVHLTHQRHRVGQLANYVQRLEEGIDALPEAFVLYDRDDRLLIANSQYAKLYPTVADILRPGITFQEIARAALERGQFLHDEGADEWLDRRIAFHEQGEGFFEQHLNDGRWIQLSERRTRSGGVTSIRADITLLKQRESEQRRATKLAESSSRSMARFLAMFSHEVRNGLNGVAGLAQMLALEAESQTHRHTADLMVQSTRRLTAVLSDLLDYLKNSATGVTVSLEAVDPRGVLDALRAELEPRAAQLGLAMRWEVSPDVPDLVRTDPGRILQVLANLGSNALKYSHRGTVTVSLSRQEERLRYEVRDEGIGIAPEDQRRLFEFFVRVGPGHADSTGLGLVISKQIVAAMGGVIGVESQPGQGSRFWFDLPLRSATSDERLAITASVENATALRVGVIDDDPLNRAVAQALLQRLGHEAVVFEDSEKIMAYVRDFGLDVLMLDLMMPGETGFEVAARLCGAKHSAFKQPVLVALTGNVVPDSVAACQGVGIDVILQKPLFLGNLQHALNWAVSTRRTAPGAPPEVFPVLKAPGEFAAEVPQAGVQLARLAADIGATRFRQSLRAARKLFEQAALARLDDADALARTAHRVAGTAAQLGFDQLGELARRIDTLLSTSGQSQAVDAALLARFGETARASLPVIDEALRRGRRGGSTVRA